MAYQSNIIVLFEEFNRYLSEETIQSVAIEGIIANLEELEANKDKNDIQDKRIKQVVNYYNTAKELYQVAKTKADLSEGLIILGYQKLWEGFDMPLSYRDTNMFIMNAKFEPPIPERIPYLMKKLLDWLKSSKLETIRKAASFHLLFEVIHPFIDGNGRLGRILLNYILIQNGLINVGFNDKQKYIKALRESEAPAIWIIDKFLMGRSIDIDTYFIENPPTALESLIRERILSSLKIYANIKNVYIDTKTACEILGYKNPDYIRVLIHRNKIHGIKEHNEWKVSLSSVIDLASKHENIEQYTKFIRSKLDL